MPVQLNPSNKTPFVLLDSEEAIFMIEGVILPEDTHTFFTPILKYIDSYLTQPKKISRIELNIEYFNTASSRMLFSLLKNFNDKCYNSEIELNWYFEEDDYDMEEVGEELSSMLPNINFKFRKFNYESSPRLKDSIQLVQG